MIKWHEATWYSRLIGIVVFLLGLPVICFYLGYQFRDTLQVLTESGQSGISTPARSWVRDFDYTAYLPGAQVLYTCDAQELSGELGAGGTSTLTPPKRELNNPANAASKVSWDVRGNHLTLQMGDEIVYDSYLIPVTFPQGDRKSVTLVDRKLISGTGCGLVIASSKEGIERYTK